MANNIDPEDVRAAGGWTATEAPDATLLATPFIPTGDAWLYQKLGDTLTNYIASDERKGKIAKAAETYFVAYLFATRPYRGDFKAGIVESKHAKAGDIEKNAKLLLKNVKELLASIDIKFHVYGAVAKYGDDYHPQDDDDTQVDIALGADWADETFNVMGSVID